MFLTHLLLIRIESLITLKQLCLFLWLQKPSKRKDVTIYLLPLNTAYTLTSGGTETNRFLYQFPGEAIMHQQLMSQPPTSLGGTFQLTRVNVEKSTAAKKKKKKTAVF